MLVDSPAAIDRCREERVALRAVECLGVVGGEEHVLGGPAGVDGPSMYAAQPANPRVTRARTRRQCRSFMADLTVPWNGQRKTGGTGLHTPHANRFVRA